MTPYQNKTARFFMFAAHARLLDACIWLAVVVAAAASFVMAPNDWDSMISLHGRVIQIQLGGSLISAVLIGFGIYGVVVGLMHWLDNRQEGEPAHD